ncbi:hypothetical protein HDV00_011585, partial [Rhizophlyctis rosea]
HQSHRTNETLYWRKKYRDLEGSKHDTEDLVAQLRKQLERETKEKGRVRDELEALRQWQTAQLRVNFGMDGAEGEKVEGGRRGTAATVRKGRGPSGVMSPDGFMSPKGRGRSRLVEEEEGGSGGSGNEGGGRRGKGPARTTSKKPPQYVHPPAHHSASGDESDVPAPSRKSVNKTPYNRPPPDDGSDMSGTEDDDERLREAKIRLAYDTWVVNKGKEGEKEKVRIITAFSVTSIGQCVINGREGAPKNA